MGDDCDGERIELAAPLPELASHATIEFRGPKQGLLKRSHGATRATADHAVLRLDVNGRVEERELTVAEADAWLAEARAFQDRVAAKRAEREATAQTADEYRAERAARRAAITPTCPYCGLARRYVGERHLAWHPDLDTLLRENPTRSVESMHLYSCDRCGSAEWFSVGPLEHPLGP